MRGGPLLARLARAAGTLLGVTLLTFATVYALPADPAALQAGASAGPETIARIRERLGLDRPLWEQYGSFLARLVRGDLGTSFTQGRPVSVIIAERVPATLALALAGWTCWLAFGMAFGVWMAAARGRPVPEALFLAVTVLGVSTPTFWVGILLLSVFVGALHLLPAGGSGSPAQLVLPVAALALPGVAYYARLSQAYLAEVLDQDYIRTARAKGVPNPAILLRHALRNSVPPILTLAGTDLALLMGGVVFTESVFDYKGIGQLAVKAVGDLDLPVLVGVVLLNAVCVIAAGVVIDVLVAWWDPRIRDGATIR